MGFVSIMGWGQNTEPLLWFIMIISASVLIEKKIKQQLFIHCMLIGLSWGVDCTIVQALFMDTLFKNNPHYGLTALNNFSPPAELILIGIGAFSGILSGLLIWVIQRFINKNK